MLANKTKKTSYINTHCNSEKQDTFLLC